MQVEKLTWKFMQRQGCWLTGLQLFVCSKNRPTNREALTQWLRGRFSGKSTSWQDSSGCVSRETLSHWIPLQGNVISPLPSPLPPILVTEWE